MIVSASRRPAGLGRPAGFALLLLLVAGGIIGYVYMTNKPPEPVDAGPGIRAYLEQQAGYLTMAEGLTDKDDDLVADPPASGLLNPDTLLFCEINTVDPNKDEERWKPFMDHLARVTGKKVQYVKALDAPAEKVDDGTPPEIPAPSSGALAALAAHVDALKAGRVHVTAFATGSVPAAVNKGGFVPLFCPGDENGKFGYEMEIVVRADSPIQSPADLKGKKLAFVGMTSNSGAKAPIVLLKEEFGLTAGRDYDFGFTGSHGKSIREVQAAGGADAACVANDLLGAEVGAGRVKEGALRSIYKSSTFPPLCFGVKHDLDPALSAKIKEAFTSFNDLPKVYGKTPNRVKFAAVDYKRDWAYVIDIDKRLKGVAAK
jgi:phosphonate transport system substrate-binding protein